MKRPTLKRPNLKRPVVVNTVLAVILVGLCAWLALFAVGGGMATPGSTPAEEQAQAYSDIKDAARAETLAFLEIDHTRMDELTSKVLKGATGEFKKEYQSSLDALKKAATSQESFSDGHVDEIGLGKVDADSAAVYVAAGSKVRNKGTKGEVEDRSWRIKLSMVKEGGQWLVSKLEFVG